MNYAVVNIRNCVKKMIRNTFMNDFKVFFFFVNATEKKKTYTNKT